MLYTYLLINSIDNIPFYAGKGSGNRMYQHIRNALNENYPNRSVHCKILSIIKKGGSIVYRQMFHETEQEAFENEILLIEQYGRKDLNKGTLCNLTDGGEGSINTNKESVRNRADKHIGMKRSDESKERMRQVQLTLVQERIAKYGAAVSPETSKKMSKSRKGKQWSENARAVKRNNPKAQAVLVYLKLTGEFVAEFDSIASCAKELNCDHSSVWKICKGDWTSKTPDGVPRPFKSHKGYIFKYKEQVETIIKTI